MTTAPTAVIFDMDGVVLDSEPYWQEAERTSFGEVGLALSDADLATTVGMRIDEVVGCWMRRRPWDAQAMPVDQVAARIVERVIESIRRDARRLPGVGELLARLRRRRVRVALASSSSQRIIDTAIEALGLEGAFEFTYSAEREAHGKPHPAVYLTAARKLGLDPGACLAIEDSIAGLEAALAAGMRCVMVPDPRLRDRAEVGRATLVLDSLEGLDDELWERLG